MKHKHVIQQVSDMNIWYDAVWVNIQQQTFFVPIWRNGNTEFINRNSIFNPFIIF